MNNDEAINFFEKGSIHLVAGEFDLTIKDYNQAIILNPEYAEVFNNRGGACDKKYIIPNGMDVCKALRFDDKTRDLAIIMLTARNVVGSGSSSLAKTRRIRLVRPCSIKGSVAVITRRQGLSMDRNPPDPEAPF